MVNQPHFPLSIPLFQFLFSINCLLHIAMPFAINQLLHPVFPCKFTCCTILMLTYPLCQLISHTNIQRSVSLIRQYVHIIFSHPNIIPKNPRSVAKTPEKPAPASCRQGSFSGAQKFINFSKKLYHFAFSETPLNRTLCLCLSSFTPPPPTWLERPLFRRLAQKCHCERTCPEQGRRSAAISVSPPVYPAGSLKSEISNPPFSFCFFFNFPQPRKPRSNWQKS